MSTPARPQRFGPALVFIVGLLVLGFFVGGFVGGRLLGGGGMGVDRLADVLGGVMAGMAIAFVLALLVVGRLSNGARLGLGLLALAASVALLLFLRATDPRRPAGGETPQPTAVTEP